MSNAYSRSKTHYDQLGVKPTASPQQIRRAFRDLSKLYHPDTTELPAAEATERFQQLNEAYAILSSPDRRWTYDQQVGYSRISVMQPLEALNQQATPQRREPANMYLDPTDRPLSAGEIFALFILGLTFVACLALVVTVGLTRGDYAADREIDDYETVTPVAGSAPTDSLSRSGVETAPEGLPAAAPPLPVAPTPAAPTPSLPSSPTWL
ncbi:J domain-containing protein [Nodosilinea sp. LEGE 07088]|uniref:J domain-containing protein n=1 Tax=Nodosilinea sp. LEGE 07088 TaxID=2777968 RepID=UPI001880057B|nr:J domain-containing protein [Nodosilinea sp. LEGE 07088]MBE9135972.1 J domain-containing protein [Nodosilinea sp. LEGE 07088]